ncbi:hypothetical protein AHAS_Ahas19G0266100 [Arachis hypogaea]
MHILPMNVQHKLLKELAYSFYLSRNTVDIRCSIINITPENIAVALGLTASDKIPGQLWVPHWTRQFLVKRIQAEIKQDMEIAKRAQVRKQLKQRKKVEKKEKRSVIFAESEMQSKKRKQFIEDSSSKKETKSSKKETGSENEMQEKFTNLSETGLHSTEAHYDPSEIIPAANLASENDDVFQT